MFTRRRRRLATATAANRTWNMYLVHVHSTCSGPLNKTIPVKLKIKTQKLKFNYKQNLVSSHNKRFSSKEEIDHNPNSKAQVNPQQKYGFNSISQNKLW